MFNSYEFTFGGESSAAYGLMLYNIDTKAQGAVPFANKASIVETRTAGRIQPIHFDVNYNASPLEFNLVFGAQRALDRREMSEIAFWLTGHKQYQWLSIDQDDLSDVQFRCLVTSLTPIHVGWLPFAFEATVRCDCPYAYGYPFTYEYEIDGEAEILFTNEGTVRDYIRPSFTFVPAEGVTQLSIVNMDDGEREFRLKDIPLGSEVSVDNLNGIITDTVNGANLYEGFSMNFLRMAHGDNHLVVNGNGTLTLSGRFLYNVGA